MRNNRAQWLAICLVAACFAGCGEDDADKSVSCQDVTCPAGSVCNEKTGLCENSDKCKDVTCEKGQTCNAETGKCEAQTVTDKCANITCRADETCNAQTGECEPQSAEDKCKDVTCKTGETCNAQTGKCEGQSDEDKCKDVTCKTGETCNAQTGKCEAQSAICNGKTCNATEKLDETTCKCVPVSDGDCMSDSDCKTDVTYPEYCNLATHTCENGLCKGKTWDKSYQFCSVTGIVQCYDGFCDGSGIESCACEGTCNMATHRCASACEETEGNIVVNGSFEDWTGSAPDGWTLVSNTYAMGGKVQKSAESSHCQSAARLTNSSEKIDRLESYQIAVGQQTFTGGNAKYKCSIDAFGYGNLNLGFRKLDAEGNQVEQKTDVKKVDLYNTDTFKSYEFSISADPDETPYIQILLGFDKKTGGTDDADITIDNLVCVPEGNICDNVECEEWEICSVSSTLKDDSGKFIGKCVARDGFCTMEKTAKADELRDSCNTAVAACNTTTHLCEHIAGKCLKHEDCETGQKCLFTKQDETTTANTCVAGDRCTKDNGDAVVCKYDWQSCNAQSGSCVLNEGKCFKSSDCPEKTLPICDYSTHTCVAIDAKVGEKSLNIVPNGGFEEWEEVKFSESEKATVYVLPVAWFATEYTIYPTHLVTEIDANNVKEYTAAVHGGTKAVQLIYAKDKQSKRFSSEGFDVPSSGGTGYDCSYFARGKGSVRIHSFSSLGDMPKTEFTEIDSLEWTRIPFSIREGKDLRLVFYVGSTSADKDHIQIDDVSCVKWTY